MTQHQVDLLRDLVKSHPTLSEEKQQRRIKRIEYMVKFYRNKALDAPEKQRQMFEAFISALIYAITIIRMYSKLTKQIALVAEGSEPIKPAEPDDPPGTLL